MDRAILIGFAMLSVSIIFSSLATNSFDVFAQIRDRTLLEVDADLRQIETAAIDRDTKIASLEDSQRDFNPMIEQYDTVVIIPPTSPNADSGTLVSLACGDTGELEIPIGFSWEIGDSDVRTVDKISFRTFQVGLGSPFFNNLDVEVYNSGNRDVLVEFFINCATIDVLP